MDNTSSSLNDLTYELDSLPYVPSREVRNYLHLAYALAYDSNVNKSKHCAFMLDKHEDIVSAGVNKVQYTEDGSFTSTHAEVNSLGDNISDYSELTMVVIKISRLGGFANSRPCKSCHDTIKATGVQRIIWSSGKNAFRYTYLG